MTKRKDKAFQQGLQRIETLISTIEATAPPPIRASASELVQALLELHGAGIERMLDLTWEAGEAGPALINDVLARDELVGSLLLLHGLHPLDLETRVVHALDKVRPYLGSHGGDVELLGVDDGVVRLRLQGSCDGCPSSQMTLKYAIEDGIYAAAPDVTSIEVEGAAERPFTMPPSGVIPLTLVSSDNGRPTPMGEAWVSVGGLTSLGDGALRVISVSGTPILFCRIGETFVAYGNTCPSCGQLLGQATLAGRDLVCARCGHRYDILRAGRDLDQPNLHLEPIPLLVDRGQVTVALPALSEY